MNHPVCVYRDEKIATVAASCARNNGASARVKTETLKTEGKSEPVFVLKTTKSDTQKVLDTIADASDQFPDLTENAERCPQCESILVEFPERPEVSPTMNGVSKLMDGIGKLLQMEDKSKFHCKHCEFTWN